MMGLAVANFSIADKNVCVCASPSKYLQENESSFQSVDSLLCLFVFFAGSRDSNKVISPTEN